MVRIFENPANKYREEISKSAPVSVLFLGVFYLLYKGLWAHAFAWIFVVGLFPAFTAPALVVFTLPLATIFYALAIKQILAGRYLKKGWIEVGADALPSSGAADPADIRACPFCAEPIKVAAVKCKHCQSDLPAAA